MSDTFKTSTARFVHKIKKAALGMFNSGDRSRDDYYQAYIDVKQSATRYGNKRKHEAAKKVRARRTDRKDAAAELRNTMNDQDSR